MKKKSRLLSLVLSLAMVLTLTATPVLAADTDASGEATIGSTVEESADGIADEEAGDGESEEADAVETDEVEDADGSGSTEEAADEAAEALTISSVEDTDDTKSEDDVTDETTDESGAAVVAAEVTDEGESESDSSESAETTTYDATNGVASVTLNGTTTYYGTFADAVAAATSGSTVTLLGDASGNGIIIGNIDGQCDFTIDFNNYTYTVNGSELAGSTNTKNQCFQLLKATGSLTMKNGTIVADNSNIRIIIQNYCSLTLDSMTLNAETGTNNVSYVLSNNNGSTTITGNTTITAKSSGVAFDVYYWPSGGYNTVSVTIDSSSVTINGTIEYGSDGTDNGKSNVAENALLAIEAGTVNGSISTYNLDSDGVTNITITGGTFSTDVSDYTTSTSTAVANSDGTYTVVTTVENAVALVYDADGNYTGSYTTLKTAYAATPDGGTMALIGDVDGEQLGASSDKAITLDLNGHTISRSSGSVIDSSKGTLTITDSSQTDSTIGTGMVKGTGGVAVKMNGGSVVLESGTLESTSSYAVALSSGALTVNGGAVIAASSANCIVYYTNGTLTIKGGLFTFVERTSSVTESEVTSGAIVNAGSSAAASDNVQVSIEGGIFQTYRPLLGTSIKLEITGGYFLSKYAINNYCPDGYAYTSGNSYTYLGVTYSDYYSVAHVNFTLTVVSSDDSTETSYYTTLVQAVNAAISAYSNNSDAEITITLENDYETGKVPVESAVVFTLDLNGNTLTSTDKGAFKINNSGAKVTITDNSEDKTGTVTTVASVSVTSSTSGLLQVVNGTLNITNGNYNQNAGSSVFVVSTNGTVKVEGGYFTSDPSNYVTESYVAAQINDETYSYIVIGVVLGVSENSLTEVTATSISGYGTNTLYVGVSSSNISSYSTSSYPTTSLTFTDDDGEEHTYIFAGWYSYSNDTYSAMTSWPTSNAYAKFVDADCLGVICVYTPTALNDNGKDALRFFSSMDSLSCQGFGFVVNNTTYTCTSYITDHTITNSSMDRKFTSADVSENANILMTYRIYVDSLAENYSVYAYWVTGDGTKVCGSELTFTPSSATASTIYGE